MALDAIDREDASLPVLTEAAFTLPAGQSVTDWHTYAVHWTASRIEWWVDPPRTPDAGTETLA